ncbi:MAG: hypothetical protein ABI543_09935 [Ignavibacteria bacterium]
MELHLRIIGVILILLAIIHASFPRQFSWKGELSSLSLINRQMMYVHTFFIAFTVLLMGALCIYSASDIINTPLGRQIAFGFFIFWGIRFIFQFFVYSSKLWKGKRFETSMHILFSITWIYLTVIFFMIAFEM